MGKGQIIAQKAGFNWSWLALGAVLFLVASDVRAADTDGSTLLHSLFDPGTNAHARAGQGYSVAVDGNRAVVAAPYDSIGRNWGVVRIYHAITGALLLTLTNPIPVYSDVFGASVAISGTRVAVGAPSSNFRGSGVGRVYVFDVASAMPAVPAVTLDSPDPMTFQFFGGAVALDGARLVVGALNADLGAEDSGGAVVYDLASNTPTLPAVTLVNPEPLRNGFFAFSVAISGAHVVVGTPNGPAPNYQGSAYVYDLAGLTPDVPVTKLTGSDPTWGDGFGWAVAISGTRVVVGAPSYGTAEINEGRSFVFEITSVTPSVPIAMLAAPEPVLQGLFGSSVTISGTRVVVAGQAGIVPWFQDEMAYLYDLAGANPTVPEVSFVSPSGPDDLGSKASVAISGSQVLIGARSDDTHGFDSGSGYLYDVASTTPDVPVAALYDFSLATDDQFGRAVAISGRWLVVGAHQDEMASSFAGCVYAYDLAGAMPTIPVLTLRSPDPQVGERFGSDLAIFGTRVVVGATEADFEWSDGAIAYVFDLTNGSPTKPLVTLINPTRSSADDPASRVDISGTRVVAGNVPARDTNALVHVYDLSNQSPSLPIITLTNRTPVGVEALQIDVGISGTRVIVGLSGMAPTTEADSGTGIVRVFDLTSPQPNAAVATLLDPNPDGHGLFGRALDIEGTRIAVAAVGDFISGQAFDRVYVFDLGTATPTIPTLVLTNPAPAVQRYGVSVALSGTRLVVGAAARQTKGVGDTRAYVYDLAASAPAVPVAILNPPTRASDAPFEIAVAIDGAQVVIGSPFDDTNGFDRGAAYVFGLGPVLSIVSAGPGAARLSWPQLAQGVVLQYSDSLSPASWLNAASGTTNPVTILTTNRSRFYRLFQP